MPNTRDAVHASFDELELYVSGRLEPERVSALDCHLLECQTCREGLAQSIGLQLTVHPIGKAKSEEKDERSEPRFHTGDEAIFQELSPLSLDRQDVKIVDVSKNGVAVLAPKSVMLGTIVQVRIKSNVELGEVRHCSASGDEGYRIGLRLHHAF